MSLNLPLVLLVLVVLLALSLSLGCRSVQERGFDAHAYVADGALLLDVRTPAEFAGGHLQGAKNIPVDELAGRLAELGSKETPVVVYCRSGGRSNRALGMLHKAGFEGARDLGAMSNW